MHATELPTRRVSFAYPDDMDPVWSPRLPEFAAAANVVSLMMPYVEPYVVRSVRSALDDLEPELRTRAEGYLRQEGAHHREHQRFNRIVVGAYPGLTRVERWTKRTFDWLWRTRSRGFGLAFAAGAEGVAYSAARWVEARMGTMFAGADPVPSTLLLWHLAEEVEHKEVAFDVWHSVDDSRRRYVAGMLAAFVALAWFTVCGTTVQLWATRRIFSPNAHLRLWRWSLSFVFEALPVMLMSAMRGHHPSSLVDPSWYALWLRSYDPATDTMPLWQPPA